MRAILRRLFGRRPDAPSSDRGPAGVHFERCGQKVECIVRDESGKIVHWQFLPPDEADDLALTLRALAFEARQAARRLRAACAEADPWQDTGDPIA